MWLITPVLGICWETRRSRDKPDLPWGLREIRLPDVSWWTKGSNTSSRDVASSSQKNCRNLALFNIFLMYYLSENISNLMPSFECSDQRARRDHRPLDWARQLTGHVTERVELRHVLGDAAHVHTVELVLRVQHLSN